MSFISRVTIVILLTIIGLFMCGHGYTVFDWIKYDKFDEVDAHFRSVSGGTCRSKSKSQMVMRRDVVSQLPVFNQLLSKVWYANRTALIHLHNMALNRAFFYSYILQRMNDTASFSKQPNWLYYYLSSSADINANPFMLNGSSIYFDQDCYYPNWYETWLPDAKGDKDSLTKFTYNVGIKRSNVTGHFITQAFESFAFFGPSMPGAQEQDSQMLPVQWTTPYFDCGGSNKWVVSAVAPVVDYMPRYSNFTHLRRQRIVGLAVMDIDLNKIDFNSCGVSAGNPGPSYLSGIHKCKKTTSCKHVSGFGLKRGGYKCVCKAGTKYPWDLEPVFMGTDIEQATELEYKQGFSCEPTNYGLVLPVIDNFQGVHIQDKDWTPDKGVSDSVDKDASRSKRSRYRVTKLRNNHLVSVETINEDELREKAKDVSNHTSYVNREEVHSASGQEELRLKSFTKDKCTDEDDLTFQEMMALADRIRDMQDKRRSNESSSGHTPRSDMENFANRNEQDLRTTQALQRVIAPDLTKELNVPDVTHKSLLQLQDRRLERSRYNKLSLRSRSRHKRDVFDETSFNRMMRILRQKASVTSSNCHLLPKHQLYLPGDVNFGVHSQFEPEGRTALRLTHFLSVYLQNAQPEKHYGNIAGGGYLQEEQMYGEVLANVMGNFRIVSAGLFFDRNTFAKPKDTVRELFGPMAFRKDGAYYVIDTAGLPWQYVNEDWFLQAKSRFQSNFAGLPVYKIKAHIRSNPPGKSTYKFGFYPITYRAATYAQGYWTRPHFRCDGHVNVWVVTYVSPFFGLDSRRRKLEFRGVATVDVPLDRLQINQCPQPFSVANAFKNTARCDYLSTACSPIAGFPFSRGAYMCTCKPGFEYWHADGKEWFEGSFMELEYEKKKAGVFSRFDHLYCRPSAAHTAIPATSVLLHGLLLQTILWAYQL